MKFLVQQQPAYIYTGSQPFDPAKPSIVFIHGAANDHSVWTLQARYFANHGFNALAVDLPGHGRSFAPAKSTIRQYSDWLIGLLDAGAIGKAVMVGHSMGSLIALDVAAQFPQRVAKLALLGVSVPMPVADALLDAARHRPQEAIDMLNIWGHASQTQRGASPVPGTSVMRAYKCLLEKCSPGVLASDLAACHEFILNGAQFAAIQAKTLVLSGSRDMMTPPKANVLIAQQIVNARLQSLSGIGHAMMQEAPGTVLDALRHFVQS